MIFQAVKLAVSIVVLTALIWWTDATAIAHRLRGANLAWLFVATLTLTVVTCLMARRWQVVAARLNIEMTYKTALGEYFIGQMINLMLPGGVIGDVSRAMRMRKQGDLIMSAQSVAVERIIGQLAIFVLISMGFFGAFLLPGGIAWPLYIWGIVAALSCVAVLVLALANRTNNSASFIAFLISSSKDVRLLGYGLLIASLLIFSMYACARATGTTVPPEGWLTLLPLVLSAMLIPLSVAGSGWREGAAAALFPLIGASPEAGIAMGIAYGAIMLASALPALYFMMQAPARENCNDEPRLDCL